MIDSFLFIQMVEGLFYSYNGQFPFHSDDGQFDNGQLPFHSDDRQSEFHSDDGYLDDGQISIHADATILMMDISLSYRWWSFSSDDRQFFLFLLDDGQFPFHTDIQMMDSFFFIQMINSFLFIEIMDSFLFIQMMNSFPFSFLVDSLNEMSPFFLENQEKYPPFVTSSFCPATPKVIIDNPFYHSLSELWCLCKLKFYAEILYSY